jgi:hypothetical protein
MAVRSAGQGSGVESTGVYWMPVWNVLERYGLQLLLINPEHYKAVRGKKTDRKDGTCMAELLQDGRLEAATCCGFHPSFAGSDTLSHQAGAVSVLASEPHSEIAGAMQHQTSISSQRCVGG